MRLNEKEVQMFDNLRKTDTGRELVKYIERLSGDVCDVRNWTEKDTAESARQAARVLKEFRDHLTTSVGTKNSEPSQYI